MFCIIVAVLYKIQKQMTPYFLAKSQAYNISKDGVSDVSILGKKHAKKREILRLLIADFVRTITFILS